MGRAYLPHLTGYEELKHFTEHLRKLAAVHSGLSRPLANALVLLADNPADSDQDVAFPDLSMSQLHTLFKSQLYLQCMAAKVERRISQVRAAHGASNGERLLTVTELLKHELTGDQRKALEFAHTMLSGIAEDEIIAFLLEDWQLVFPQINCCIGM